MSSKRFRKAVAAAAVLSAGVATAVVVIGAASASHPGSGASLLSSSNGGATIKFSSGSPLAIGEAARFASWSADGGKAAYINAGNDVEIAANGFGFDFPMVTNADHPSIKQHPTWTGDGDFVFWSEQANAQSPWTIAVGVTGAFEEFATIVSEPGFDYTNPDGGPNESVVFQRQVDSNGAPTGQADVYGISDPNTSIVPTLMVSDAAQPSISPDGTKLAWVRSDGTNTQVFVSDLAGGNVVPVSSNGFNHSNPTWSPDSSTIAFNQGTAVFTAPADGSQAPTVVSALPNGLPSYQPVTTEKAIRLSGKSRFGTAIAVSQAQWPDASNAGDKRPKAQSVVLSRSDTFADALGGSALAAAKQGPLLLTPTDALNTDTATEIKRVLGDSSGTVYLLGSADGALSPAVAAEVQALSPTYTVTRLAGKNRFGTATAVAGAINPAPDLILAATGNNFPDALGAGAAAGAFDVPGSTESAVVVLTSDGILPAETKTYIDNAIANNPTATVYGIGTQGLQATHAYDPVDVAHIPGQTTNRYVTSFLTATTFFGPEGELGNGLSTAGLATSLNWPDALSGGSFLAALGAPLLVAGPTGLDPFISTLVDLESTGINTLYAFGGPTVVTEKDVNEFGSLMSGPGSFGESSTPLPFVAQQQRSVGPAKAGATPKGNTRTLQQILHPTRLNPIVPNKK